jgi:hypothetical protein
MKNPKILIIGGIVVVVILVIGGIAAIFIIKSNNNNNPEGNNAASNNNRVNGINAANFAVVNGKVSSISSQTAVVDSSDGQGQRIVIISGSTVITKEVTANKDDLLKTGQTISVQWTKNGDNIMADTISLPRQFNQQGNSNNGAYGGQFRGSSGNAGNGGRQFAGGGSPTDTQNVNTYRGTIDKIDGNNVEIKTQNGTVYNIIIQDSTKYQQQEQGTVADLVVDKTVTVIGNTDSTGSITARNITILN